MDQTVKQIFKMINHCVTLSLRGAKHGKVYPLSSLEDDLDQHLRSRGSSIYVWNRNGRIRSPFRRKLGIRLPSRRTGLDIQTETLDGLRRGLIEEIQKTRPVFKPRVSNEVGLFTLVQTNCGQNPRGRFLPARIQNRMFDVRRKSARDFGARR